VLGGRRSVSTLEYLSVVFTRVRRKIPLILISIQLQLQVLLYTGEE
jgi:hypothetical protein